ncbi:hypothetical protein EWM64_g5095 [Hericium alpestre]|uniref:Uncharacterized protein n=1 Tax=Hericium alpestre TaxID=135208 RepID=A0A4Y9ZZP7_9AGAM|nr:hypothetical protein EWM64_g5095 [Hericium alpestre]
MPNSEIMSIIRDEPCMIDGSEGFYDEDDEGRMSWTLKKHSVHVLQQFLNGQGYRQVTINSEPNSKNHVYGSVSYDAINGKRGSPVATYFQTAKARPKFTYRDYTLVSNVTRNGAQITGAQASDTYLGPNGVIPLTPTAVLSWLGSFGTPRILFESGIDPSDML